MAQLIIQSITEAKLLLFLDMTMHISEMYRASLELQMVPQLHNQIRLAGPQF